MLLLDVEIIHLIYTIFCALIRKTIWGLNW